MTTTFRTGARPIKNEAEEVFLASLTFANLLFPSQQARRRATLAQLVEQLIRNQQVAGSNPAGGSDDIQEVLSCSSDWLGPTPNQPKNRVGLDLPLGAFYLMTVRTNHHDQFSGEACELRGGLEHLL